MQFPSCFRKNSSHKIIEEDYLPWNRTSRGVVSPIATAFFCSLTIYYEPNAMLFIHVGRCGLSLFGVLIIESFRSVLIRAQFLSRVPHLNLKVRVNQYVPLYDCSR